MLLCTITIFSLETLAYYYWEISNCKIELEQFSNQNLLEGEDKASMANVKAVLLQIDLMKEKEIHWNNCHHHRLGSLRPKSPTHTQTKSPINVQRHRNPISNHHQPPPGKIASTCTSMIACCKYNHIGLLKDLNYPSTINLDHDFHIFFFW